MAKKELSNKYKNRNKYPEWSGMSMPAQAQIDKVVRQEYINSDIGKQEQELKEP